jgi:hypothetical protein
MMSISSDFLPHPSSGVLPFLLSRPLDDTQATPPRTVTLTNVPNLSLSAVECIMAVPKIRIVSVPYCQFGSPAVMSWQSGRLGVTPCFIYNYRLPLR